MIPLPKIIFHVGPHKTATTFIQRTMEDNYQKLKRHRVGYIPLVPLRKNVTHLINSKTFSYKDVYDYIFPYLNCRVLVLFDENFLGGLVEPTSNNLYPNLKYRMEFMSGFFNHYGFEYETHFILREMSGYLESRYSERVRNTGFVYPNDYYSHYDCRSASWIPVLNEIHEFTGSNINVSDFEYAVNNISDYISLMSGFELKVDPYSGDDGAVSRRKFSPEIYEAIKLLSKAYPDKAIVRALEIIERYEPINKSRASVIGDEVKADLLERWEDERKSVYRLPFVNIVGKV